MMEVILKKVGKKKFTSNTVLARYLILTFPHKFPMMKGFTVLFYSEAAGSCTRYVDLEIWLMTLCKSWCQLIIGFWTAHRIGHAFRAFPHTVIHLSRSASALLSVTSGLPQRVIVSAVFVAATSCAQTDWTKSHLNPVLRVGAPGSWDFSQAFFQTVLRRDSQYIMWYSGDDSTKFQVGRATSTDGVNWLKDSLNPVLNAGSSLSNWNYWGSWVPRVIWDGTQYLMWFMGASGSTRFGQGMKWQWGVARSVDGRSWVADSTNPINTDNLQSWWTDASGPGLILFDGTMYRTWYEGGRGLFPGNYAAIGYATSPDGVHWAKILPDPVLIPGSPGDWDESGIGYGNTVLYDAGIYQMWYTGNVIHDVTGTAGIGFAVSHDGIHWRKYPRNPVVIGGRLGSWDEHVYSPSVVLDGSVYRMWYSASDPFYSQIGYATAPRSPATILLSESSEDFQNVQPGTDSDTLSVSVSNWGSTPLIISALTHQMTEFVFPGLPPLPLTIPPFDQILLKLVFRPYRAGVTVDDTLVITSNDSLHPRSTLALRGRGKGAVLPADPGTMYATGSPQLYSIDRSDGVATLIASFSPAPPHLLQDLTVRMADNGLYGAYATPTETILYHVSSGNGDLDSAARIPLGDITAIAFSRSDSLFLADVHRSLYVMRGITGSPTLVGTIGIRISSLAFNPATGELWGSAHDTLCTINTTTGGTSIVGAGLPGTVHSSITFSPLGTLYGVFDNILVVVDDHTSGRTAIVGPTWATGIRAVAMRNDIISDVPIARRTSAETRLFQNSPNPFNPTTVISYQLSAAGEVKLEIYDLLGRTVAVLVNEVMDAGLHEARLDASGFSSGVYLYRLQAGVYTQTRKLVVLK